MKKMKFYLLHLSKKLFFVLSILYLNSCNMDRFSNPKEEIETVFFSDDMEKYAFEYINDNHLLNDDEKLMAYYDNTIACDGTDAIILTDVRLIHHNKQTKNRTRYLKH
jgi:hypothetical protein